MQLTKYFIFWILIVMVPSIISKLQKHKILFFSRTIAYEHIIFCTWKSFSTESFYLDICFYFFPFQIKYQFLRIEYKRKTLTQLIRTVLQYPLQHKCSRIIRFCLSYHKTSCSLRNGIFVIHASLPYIKSKYNFCSLSWKHLIMCNRML